MCCDGFWNNEVKHAVESVERIGQAIIDNPLPAIETLILTANGVPPEVASAAVTAINGGDPSQIATAALTSYFGSQVTSNVSSELSSMQPTQGAYIPSTTDGLLIKAASTAVGADVAVTTAALANGDNFNDALAKGTQAAVTSLATSAGKFAGSEAASNIEDPTLSKITGSATKGATTAALLGKDIGAGASKSAKGDVLDAAGNVISQYAPDLSGSTGVDLSGAKEFLQPISDVATTLAQPISDVATKVLQPLEQPIKDVAQAGSDVATTVLQPLEKPIKDVAQAGSDAVTTVLQPLEKPIKDAGTSVANTAKDVTSDLPGVRISQTDKDVMKAIANQYDTKQSSTFSASGGTTIGDTATGNTAQADTSGTTTTIGDTATGSSSTDAKGTSASPAAYGGADIAILEDVSGTLGSKGVKKGGKYPWGDPEGTTALKEGLGV